MTEHAHTHDHDADDDGDETFGMSMGFRIFEDNGELILVEVEITPYVDQPTALGATLVFHPLADLDPTSEDEHLDWPAWPTDIDDELTRDEGAPMAAQFQGIVRQLSQLNEAELREFLQRAREEAAAEDDEA